MNLHLLIAELNDPGVTVRHIRNIRVPYSRYTNN